MTSCKSFQERLAENGPDLVDTDSELRTHLPGCADCSTFLADLRQIENDLRNLDDIDAPDALVEKTLMAVQTAAIDAPAADASTRRQLWFAGGLAASVAAAASLVLVLNLPGTQYLMPNDGDADRRPVFHALAPDGNEGSFEVAELAEETARTSRLPGEDDDNNFLDLTEPEPEAASVPEVSAPRPKSKPTAQSGEREGSEESFEIAELDESVLRAPNGDRDRLVRGKTDADGFSDFADQELDGPSGRDDISRSTGSLDELAANQQLRRLVPREGERLLPPPETAAQSQFKIEGRYREETDYEAASREYAVRKSADQSASPTNQPGPSEVQQHQAVQDAIDQLLAAAGPSPEERAADHRQPSSTVTGELNARLETEDKKRSGAGDKVGSTSNTGVADMPAAEIPGPIGGLIMPLPNSRMSGDARANLEAAQVTAPDLLMRYAALDGLVFQDPTGYWANTYVPGDPAMRLLAARLDDWDRTVLGRDLRLEQTVSPVAQPFDAPRDAAVAVYLNTDTPFINAPTRMRVQVGLKGSERQGGRRPAMNIGLVVDLREPADAETATRIRALIEALERARQPEDRFSLTLAGPGGGLLVDPDQFRHGPIRVAINSLFGDAPDDQGVTVDLRQALDFAADKVLEGDDPTAVLGSSLVLLATGSSLAGDVGQIEQFAHRNAVGGVPLSVISFGTGNDLDHIDRLVAAGQGNRRVLATAQAAESVIDRELHAASRAVARALRLRIRLAPGVQLVNVLGSHRLAEPMAQRVREAEQSIDQRLARNLGITADRGDDEDGIQIVIPNFYAGDSHVILLDVVAAGPGSIADVRVRYKDVAYLRNGVAEASLAIGDQPRQAGPLERNVLKNLVAWELARQTRQAGRALADGDLVGAQALIATLRDEIGDLRAQVAGWPTDPGLGSDQTVLDDYVTALALPATTDFDQRRYLADSLTYAAFRKLQPIRQ